MDVIFLVIIWFLSKGRERPVVETCMPVQKCGKEKAFETGCRLKGTCLCFFPQVSFSDVMCCWTVASQFFGVRVPI